MTNQPNGGGRVFPAPCVFCGGDTVFTGEFDTCGKCGQRYCTVCHGAVKPPRPRPKTVTICVMGGRCRDVKLTSRQDAHRG